MSDFADRPFAAGSMIGMRAFGVDSLGRLTAPSLYTIFKPGENEAECKKLASPALAFTSMVSGFYGDSLSRSLFGIPRTPPALTSTLTTGSHAPKPYMQTCPCSDCKDARGGMPGVAAESIAEAAVEKPVPPKPEHTIGGMGCSCGFYAYFDGSNDYKEPDRLTALIEGYGVCTVGSKGYRASKARLVALVTPGKKFQPRARLDLVARNYPAVPWFPTKHLAMAEFPLHQEPAPSPDDDDFWTRSAR